MTEPKIVRPEDVDPHRDWSRPLMALGSMGWISRNGSISAGCTAIAPAARARRSPSTVSAPSSLRTIFATCPRTEIGDWAGGRKLAPAEYQGGVSVVSNLGGHRVRKLSAIINPPHATILVVGSVERRPTETEDGGFKSPAA